MSPTVVRARRIRLDQLLVERGLAANRSRAQALLLAARVRVGEGDAARADRKAGDLVDPSTPVRIVSREPYASRGGHKLAAALDAFGIDPADRICLDVGASTGGFTDVLLQRGAARVYALDVGRGQLADTLRADPRVVSMERTNARTLGPGVLPEPVALAVVDVSFISLSRVLAPIAGCFDRAVGGPIVALVKPQFEAGRGATERGVVRHPAIHREVLDRVAREAAERGLQPRSLVASPILGPEGNREFFMELEVRAGWTGGPARDADPTPAGRPVALPDDWPTRVADVTGG